MQFFWLAAVLSGLFFASLLSIRTGFFSSRVSAPLTPSNTPGSNFSDRNSWKNVYQNGRKIGISQSAFTKTESGYHLHESLYLRINTMGMAQNISLDTHGRLNPDFSLSSFDFEISSGRFRFTANGNVSGNTLSVITLAAGAVQKYTLNLNKKIYLTSGIIHAVLATNLDESDMLTVEIFDPATMSQVPVHIKIIGFENIPIMGKLQKVKKMSLDFKGITQFAWVDEEGEVLKEQGLLGISLEKTTREDALSGLPIQASQDLTQIASIPSNITIENVENLKKLKIKIDGIRFDHIHLDGGRQLFKNSILTVTKEKLPTDPPLSIEENFQATEAKFLKPSVFIQSDHPKIQNLAQEIVSSADTSLIKAQKLLAWIYKNIQKRPVLSLPDALSTLENRAGDCNEHAMLLAAMARAAGIPSTIEAGLVYLNGRFYYHAWNSLFLGRWVTADSLLGQLPADVTHLRFSSGVQSIGLDIMTIIGKVNLRIIE